MTKEYTGPERRQFLRFDYITPIACKVCTPETLSKLLEGYTADISQTGLLCNLTQKVNKDDVLWLAFDRATLNVCSEIEHRSLIYQNGVIGKVVRIEEKGDSNFSVGIQFITREEPNLTHIYPKVHFLKIEPQKKDE